MLRNNETITLIALKWFLFWLSLTASMTMSQDTMSCRYGERGSLTAICTDATPGFFKNTSYSFDHLDESMICLNCNLTHLKEGTFDISNRLRYVNLSNSHIKFIDKKAFTGLVFLNTLHLSGNSIERFDPEAFYGVRKLELLYLDNALAKPLPISVFSELRSLRELILRDNKLNELSSHTFDGLIRLEFLDLSNNQLNDLNGSLSQLKSLKVLNLKFNEITTISPNDFNGLENLISLDLSSNTINKLSLNLGVPNKLRKLDLSINHLGNRVIKPGVFENLEHLEKLNLSLNWFTHLPPKLFHGLYSLRELTLSQNFITEFYTGTFSGLPQLRFINISHNLIKSAEITGRLLLHQLHVIDFTDNKIKSFNFVEFLRRAPSIRKIYLKGNLLNCETRQHLAAYFQFDDIDFELELDNCSSLHPEELNKFRKNLEQELRGEILEMERPPSSIFAMKVTMLLLIIGLVCGLYFVQFRILNHKSN